MNRVIEIDNFIVEKPIIDILYDIKRVLTNGKLRDIINKGDNIVVTCVNSSHAGGAENKPAMNIYIGDDPNIPFGYCRCFVCGDEGNFIHFVSEAFDCSYENAKNWLIENYGKQAYEKKIIIDDIKIKKEPDLFGKVKPENKYEKVLESYEAYCPYLASRGISRETAEKLKIKYDPKYKQIVFTVYDQKGNLLTLLKRSTETKQFYIDKDLEHKPLLYMNLVQKNNLDSCLLVEGLFDAASCYENKVPGIAILGQPSEWQIEQINKSSIKVLYIATDNDSAGREFRKIIKEKLSPRILTVDVIMPAGKKDVGDLSKADWQELIKKYNIPEIN